MGAVRDVVYVAALITAAPAPQRAHKGLVGCQAGAQSRARARARRAKCRRAEQEIRSLIGSCAPGAQIGEEEPVPTPSTAQATAQATATPTATPSSTVLSSQGGTVVADCRPGGAYLVSWSPDPGYESGTVIRGPVAMARVTFNSTANSVTVMVSCSGGVPTAISTVSGSGGPGDGGGGGGE